MLFWQVLRMCCFDAASLAAAVCGTTTSITTSGSSSSVGAVDIRKVFRVVVEGLKEEEEEEEEEEDAEEERLSFGCSHQQLQQQEEKQQQKQQFLEQQQQQEEEQKRFHKQQQQQQFHKQQQQQQQEEEQVGEAYQQQQHHHTQQQQQLCYMSHDKTAAAMAVTLGRRGVHGGLRSLVECLWLVLSTWGIEQQQAFVKFVTGSDRWVAMAPLSCLYGELSSPSLPFAEVARAWTAEGGILIHQLRNITLYSSVLSFDCKALALRVN
jgi:hypothetical protein